MADKYIRNNGGTLTETEAITSSAGAVDAGKIIALDSTGRIDNSMMPVGSGDSNIDGGFANSVYLPSQLIDGGDANG